MKNKITSLLFTGLVCMIFIMNSCKQPSDAYTRGVGIYPGDPKEDFSPDPCD